MKRKLEIKVTKEQFERLIESVNKEKMTENLYSQGNPGEGAAEGMIQLANQIKKAWNYITDPDTKQKAKDLLAALAAGANSATSVGTREGQQRRKPVVKENKPAQRKIARR